MVIGIHRRQYSEEEKEEIVQFLLRGQIGPQLGKNIASSLCPSTFGRGNTWMEKLNK